MKNICFILFLILMAINSIAFADVIDIGMGTHDIFGVSLKNNFLFGFFTILDLIIVIIIIHKIIKHNNKVSSRIINSILCILLGYVFLCLTFNIIYRTADYHHSSLTVLSDMSLEIFNSRFKPFLRKSNNYSEITSLIFEVQAMI